MKIRTNEQLDSVLTSCTEGLKNKMEGFGGKRAVLLCGGTGCLSSHSNEIKNKFNELIAEYGISDKVTVNQVGCFGFCSQG
ncbi:MAG: (2Fe-2S) ferredoxin domain-containing protein, partial [Clostridia bacterium]|nr:(2Fe-2S) ferredoxin domain-containing protein [Clostridia bacterium]